MYREAKRDSLIPVATQSGTFTAVSTKGFDKYAEYGSFNSLPWPIVATEKEATTFSCESLLHTRPFKSDGLALIAVAIAVTVNRVNARRVLISVVVRQHASVR